MAREAIDARLAPAPVEVLPLSECVGQILREDVYAERDNPPFDRVCMDGIAIRSEVFGKGVRRFTIEATQAAGAPALTLSGAEAAIEVMTGAMMPRGTDCVIPLEEYDVTAGIVSLKDKASGEPYRNVQRRGSDSQPGVPMLRAGARLGAPEIAVVASAGLATVRVSRQPSFMVVSTGDELVEPGQPIAEHQIRRSNAYALVAALREHGFGKVGDDHILDSEAMLQDRLARHLAERDVLILSGGVSKGRFDFVPEGAQIPTRRRGVLSGSAAARHADVVRCWAAGASGVRAARQPRLDIDLSDPIRGAGHESRDGHSCGRAGTGWTGRTDRARAAGGVVRPRLDSI